MSHNLKMGREGYETLAPSYLEKREGAFFIVPTGMQETIPDEVCIEVRSFLHHMDMERRTMLSWQDLFTIRMRAMNIPEIMVQELLGHSKMGTTWDYTHINPVMRHRVMDRLDRLFRGEK